MRYKPSTKTVRATTLALTRLADADFKLPHGSMPANNTGLRSRCAQVTLTSQKPERPHNQHQALRNRQHAGIAGEVGGYRVAAEKLESLESSIAHVPTGRGADGLGLSLRACGASLEGGHARAPMIRTEEVNQYHRTIRGGEADPLARQPGTTKPR